MTTHTRIAILVPCYNEEAAIGKVVGDFRAALLDAAVYVYDNNSSDRTAETARAAGAIVRSEPRQGKGNVMRRMFADIDADIYVLVDGDDTYDANAAPLLIRTLVAGGFDMVSGKRNATGSDGAYRAGHVLGNRLLTGLTATMFGVNLSDMLTGYRILSRRFVKSFPFTAQGFTVETEMTVHAVRLLMPMIEIETRYKERALGSASKLNTVRDGLRIFSIILYLIREERPLMFFSALFIAFAFVSMCVGTPVVLEFLKTGLVPRLPTAVLAMGLMVLGFLALACGLILDTVTRGRWEQKRTAYLAIPGPQDLSVS